ncbi:MAG TPA: ABC transporter substrate-binding protein [Hyphomicrobiales bacterium]|nr:ABC transporter substrate-binding protein [Hyphomicrobiales bacterium]
MRYAKSLLVPLLGLTLCGAGLAHAAEPVPIRAAWIVPVTNLGSILFDKPGIARNNGKTYKFEATHYQGTTLELNALATGELDMGLLSYTSLPLAIENAHLGDLRVIIDESEDGYRGGYSTEYFVRRDSNIKSVGDLKGKVVATNAIGSAVGLTMRVELLKHGIDPKNGDVNVVEAPFPTMKTMLLSGKADLVPGALPFSTDPELRSKGRVLFTELDAMGGPSDLVFWVARKSFLDKHRAAVLDFMTDYLRAVRFYTDPKNRAEGVQIAAKFTKLPASVFDKFLFMPGKDIYRVPDGVPQAAILQSNIDVLYKYHQLAKTVQIAPYVDPSLIEEAGKRLKDEK